MSFGNIWLHFVLLERRGFLQKVAVLNDNESRDITACEDGELIESR